jgi:hypothetical protein
MARKPKAYLRHMTTLAKDTVRPPPTLPDAQAVQDMGFSLTPDEITVIRMAMAINSASRKPQLLWSGWKHISVACAIGSDHAQKQAKTSNLKDYQYRVLMSQFLRKTGFIFLNKYDRSTAVRMLPHWDEIDAWRSSLSPSRQGHLNNPKDIWEAYLEHRRKLGDPEAKERAGGGFKRKLPSVMEQMEALQQALDAAEERRDRAEAEANFFSQLADEVAARANMSDTEVARIRAEVRAKREAIVEEEHGDEDEE